MQNESTLHLAESIDIDPAALLAAAHGYAFRRLSKELSIEAEGLSIVARMARKKHIISNDFAKKLVNLDNANSIVRHLSVIKLQKFKKDVDEQLLNGLWLGPVSGPRTTSPCSSRTSAGTSSPCSSRTLADSAGTSSPCSSSLDLGNHSRDLLKEAAVSHFCLFDNDEDDFVGSWEPLLASGVDILSLGSVQPEVVPDFPDALPDTVEATVAALYDLARASAEADRIASDHPGLCFETIFTGLQIDLSDDHIEEPETCKVLDNMKCIDLIR